MNAIPIANPIANHSLRAGRPGDVVQRVIDRILNAGDPAGMLHNLSDLQKLLDQLAPETFNGETTRARIENARRFLQSQEAGAARYEIRLLANLMQ